MACHTSLLLLLLWSAAPRRRAGAGASNALHAVQMSSKRSIGQGSRRK
jgi:hypothetical protein